MRDKSDIKKTLNYLSDVLHTFLLQNEISGKICLKKTADTSTDILFINIPRNFHERRIFETGLSDILSLPFNFFSHIFQRYSAYKPFNETKLLKDLQQEILKGNMCKKII